MVKYRIKIWGGKMNFNESYIIFKKIANKISNVIHGEMKQILFLLMNIFFGIACIETLKYCDLPVLNESFKWFIKKQNCDMTIYNLSVSYIVTYIFYMLVQYFPDLIRRNERENELLPYRIAIYQEVKAFVNDVIDLWVIIAKKSYVDNKFNIKNDVKTIDDFFNEETFKIICNQIRLEEDIRQLLHIVRCNENPCWSTLIKYRLNDICNKGNTLLTRYKTDLTVELFYNIYYLMNRSTIIAQLLSQLNSIDTLKNGKNFCLSDCVFFDGRDEIDINESCQAIINLYNWVNNEYEILKNKCDNNIQLNKIDIIKSINEDLR